MSSNLEVRNKRRGVSIYSLNICICIEITLKLSNKHNIIFTKEFSLKFYVPPFSKNLKHIYCYVSFKNHQKTLSQSFFLSFLSFFPFSFFIRRQYHLNSTSFSFIFPTSMTLNFSFFIYSISLSLSSRLSRLF